MIQNSHIKMKKDEIIQIAKEIIEKKINMIEGIRKIVLLRHSINASNDEAFNYFIAFDSETDHFPIGDIRNQWSQESLEKVNIEINKYIQDSEEDTIKACTKLIDKLSAALPGET